MKDALIISVLSVVPKKPAARLMGALTRLRLARPLHRLLLRWYVRKYKVNLDDCVGGIDDYESLGQFFVRPLRPGVRPVDPDPNVLVSPVDARVYTVGPISGGTFEQSPGLKSSVAELLGLTDVGGAGTCPIDPQRYEGGSYAVLYLSPMDYHRVHTPEACRVVGYRYLPGNLWPVFPAATRKVQGVFSRNERLVFALDTQAADRPGFGTVAYAMIGAFGVGRMETVVAPLTTNTGGALEDVVLSPAPHLERAAELGRFCMGSTVILLAEPGRVNWTIRPGDVVRLGRPIGRVPAST